MGNNQPPNPLTQLRTNDSKKMNTPNDWLHVLMECNRFDHTPPAPGMSPPLNQGGPTGSARSFAITLRAMTHAWFLGDARVAAFAFPTALPLPTGANRESALHGAASRVLTRLFPQQAALIAGAAAAMPPQDSASASWGVSVADAHFDDRTNDGAATNAPYFYQSTPGAYQHDPDNYPGSVAAPAPAPQPLGVSAGNVRFFGIKNRLPLEKPPGYLSPGHVNRQDPDYLSDYAKVRKLGHRSNAEGAGGPAGLDLALRGIYWAYDGVAFLGTPPRLYFQIIEEIAGDFALTDDRKMVLYAICATALGDAGSHAWYYKYLYNIWRPVTGVRQHDQSFGKEGQTQPQPSGSPVVGDPFWTPLGAPRTNGSGKNFTPAFPAYPSGHATFGGASLHALRKVLNVWFPAKVKLQGRKDKVKFRFVSDEWNGVNRDVTGNIRPRHDREFASLEDAIVENGLSRIYLGVHWEFDAEVAGKNIGGIPLGIAIADELCTTYAAAISAV